MRVLIIGAGDVGFQLAKRLSRQKHDIIMIEADPQKVKRASEQLDAFVVEGNGASYRVLKEAGVDNIQLVTAMTDRDEVNLMACKLAKKIGVPTTIARVRNPQFTDPDFMLSQAELGTDLIIHPEKETADAVVRLIHQSCATYVVELEDGKIDVVGVRLNKNSLLLNTPLMELSQRHGNPPMRIVAIDRDYKTLIPKGNDQLLPGDEVFVVCKHDYTPTFIDLAGRKDIKIKDLMVLGGGLIGRFIAEQVCHEANIKLIENNEHRARQIADKLPQALVIQGDGTDFDLLDDEGLTDMDAFVAMTGDDEQNIITTLLAQHSRVPRSIALVNNAAYLAITSKLGVDAVVSKQALTVNAVQRYIQARQVASIVDFPSSEAQIIEYITDEGCEITRHPLQKTRFPDNAIVGAVLRQGELIIPQGDTHIQVGDKVVIITLPEAYAAVDKLFSKERSRISQFLHL